MKMSWFPQRIVVLALLTGWLSSATAETYVVNGRTNVIGSDLLEKGVPTSVREPGEYTFVLTASDFRENTGAPMSRHVVACSDSTAGDFRCFTLNGVGDSVTMHVIHAPLLFFVDTLATDNTGTSTVDIFDSEGEPVRTYVVDGRTNVIGSNLLEKGVQTAVQAPSEYTFELTASDFRENPGAPMSRHVVACSDSSAGDFRCFTLNGIGDTLTMHVIHAPLLFFVDTLTTDNVGSSTVKVYRTEDLEYQCLIVAEPGDVDEVTVLPESADTLCAGDTFYVEFWATDSGSTNTGIVSAYADMGYPEDLVACEAAGHTALFDLFEEGAWDGSIVDELGASQLDSHVGVEPERARVAYVEFTADATGQAEFVLQPADTESSAHGRGRVFPEDIHYGSCSVLIGCPCIYDLDDNCNVAAGDLGLFAPCWGCCDDEACWDEYGCEVKDFDCNGCISGGDLAWFAVGWNKTCDQIDPVADYPSCCECDGPVFCPCPGSNGGGGTASSVMVGQMPTADGPVQLTLRLRESPSQRREIARLDTRRPGALQAGESIFAEVWIKDTSPTTDGLTAVFADLFYDPSQLQAVSVDPGEIFTLLAEPITETDEGVVRRIGGATMEPGHGADSWSRVSIVELQALVDVAKPRVSVRPSLNEAVSRFGQGLVPTDQIKVVHDRRSRIGRPARTGHRN